ncbi:MAG: outer membrane protein assembly factor BamE [Minwuia sp.]|uniref:outer membrane protein assembly factor BamE n=1 Tax=Minwuia sp. TaxID=2493630 RepID=UPI003A8391BC
MPMRRSGIVAVLLLSALVVVQGCTQTRTTRGYHLELEDVDKIQSGVTTQQQVAQILGSPSSVAAFKAHADTWYYISKKTEKYTELDESVVEQKIVAISFDEAGRVAEVKQYDLADAQDISYSSRETPTQGAKLGFLEQLFQNFLGGNIGR